MSNDLEEVYENGTLIRKWLIDCDQNGDCISNSGEEGVFYYKDKFYTIMFNDTHGIYPMDMQHSAAVDISQLPEEIREPCEQYLLFMDHLVNGKPSLTCASCGAISSEGICSSCEKQEKAHKRNCIECEDKQFCKYTMETLMVLHIDTGNCVMKNDEKNTILLEIRDILKGHEMAMKGFSVLP